MLNPTRWLERSTAAVLLIVTIPVAEWLRQPAPVWVVVSCVILALAVAATRRGGWRSWTTLMALVAMVGVLAGAQWSVARAGRDWPAERERRIAAAFERLSGALRLAHDANRRLAVRGAAWAERDQAAAFQALGGLLPRNMPEMAVVILEPSGTPWAWAGRHRLIPEAEGDALAARFSRFYATLEDRQTTPSGRVVVASLLVWADSAVPRPEHSLAAQFGATHGVQLRVYPPARAPQGAEVFEYTDSTASGERPLFSLEPVPPDPASVQDQVALTESQHVGLTLIGLLVLGLVILKGSRARLMALAALLWGLLRAPLGAAIGLDDFFSPATFHRAQLRPFATSPGHLFSTAAVLLIFALWLWAERPRRRPATIALGGLLLVGAPYLINDLARGILPPAHGVTTPLWLVWQITLTVATSALILLAAACFRGPDDDTPPRRWSAPLGMAVAVVASVVGLVVWQPRVGWPEWYTFLWVPALVLVALPAPRWSTLVGTAVVAGTAAGLVTWGAELNGRMTAASRDLARLGEAEDDLATPYLHRFAEQIAAEPEPLAASDLFVAWRASLLAGQEYPVRLGLWEPDGTRRAELALDSLDVPASLLAALVRGLEPGREISVTSLSRIPGRHYLLLQRLPSGRVLTAAIGPRTRLCAATRLARLLRPPSEGPPLYEIAMFPPSTEGAVELPPSGWRRDRWEVRTDRLVGLPGGPRHAHAIVALRSLPLLLIRGTLLVAVDVLVVVLLGFPGTLRSRQWREWLALRRLARSFQVRLAVTLALFFVVPGAAFTAWSIRRLNSEADRTGDLLISSALRDAVLTASGLLQEPGDYLTQAVVDLSDRLEADLLLYSGGRLVAASAPILADLSVVEPLLDARVFQPLALGDELEVTRSATTYIAPVRVGYRVAQPGPPGSIGILATPQLTFDWERAQDQHEVTLLLLFATLVGLAAAGLGAQLAARALSRPVSDLRRSAAALGRGQPLPAVGTPPAEFEQVFGAFGRMADDIRTSQAALESARQRTAAVLANVATAVVALDPEGRIVIANARARRLLGIRDVAPAVLVTSLAPPWAPLVEVVAAFLASSDSEQRVEIESDGRTYRVQLVALEGSPGGTVLAVDDLTDVTQAARVLAWGEMARQVAHEIKNPLTPMRLGVQHLRRVRRERPDQFDAVFEATSERILAEIERLDTIARAFSRFGMPGDLAAPLEEVDLAAVSRDVGALYRLAEDGLRIDVESADGVRVPARVDEVKEVLGNLLENARQAGAARVLIRVQARRLEVRDDGPGIPSESLARVFEPRFSTTTSGSGLGLAIVRRLVEGWGATVSISSSPAGGTCVTLLWP
jgi:signal transduction histidine kinase